MNDALRDSDRGLVTPRRYGLTVATGDSSRRPPAWAPQVCRACPNPLFYKGSGPYPDYCSNACRQRAYRLRPKR